MGAFYTCLCFLLSKGAAIESIEILRQAFDPYPLGMWPTYGQRGPVLRCGWGQPSCEGFLSHFAALPLQLTDLTLRDICRLDQRSSRLPAAINTISRVRPLP